MYYVLGIAVNIGRDKKRKDSRSFVDQLYSFRNRPDGNTSSIDLCHHRWRRISAHYRHSGLLF